MFDDSPYLRDIGAHQPYNCPVFLSRLVHIGKILDLENSRNLDKNSRKQLYFVPHFISYNPNNGYVKIIYLQNIGDTVILCIMKTNIIHICIKGSGHFKFVFSEMSSLDIASTSV